MILYLIIAYAISLALGYVWAFTSATLALGKSLSGDEMLEISPRGQQDAITPPWSTNLAILVYISVFLVIAFGWWHYGWLTGLAVCVGLFIVTGFNANVLMPKSNSKHFVRIIIHSMCNRHANYVKSGDVLRASAMAILLNDLGMPVDEFVEKITGEDGAADFLGDNATAEMTVDEANHLVNAFADVMAEETSFVLDAKLLPDKKHRINLAFQVLIAHYDLVQSTDPVAYKRDGWEERLELIRPLRLRVSDFQEIDPEDEELVKKIKSDPSYWELHQRLVRGEIPPNERDEVEEYLRPARLLMFKYIKRMLAETGTQGEDE